jgi:exopolysaccharide production protein ExoQ
MDSLIRACRSQSNILIFIALLIGSGVFSHLLTGDYSVDGGRKQIALTAKLMLAFSYTLSFGLILLYWQTFKQKMTTMTWLWFALITWSIISLVIGQLNSLTMIRLVGFLGCTLLGLMLFVCTKNVKQVVLYMFGICFIIIVVNILVIDWSVLSDVSSRNIKGVFFQKNQLGQYSFLTMFVAVFVFFRMAGSYRWLSGVAFITSLWLLFLSTSMTSNMLIPIAIIITVASLVIGRYPKSWLVMGIAFILLTSVVFFYWTELFALMGKTTTFTGRTSIWTEYWALIQQRIVIGHGYGAYPEKITNWLALGFHSGYIGLLYYLGAIGGSILLAMIVLAVKDWWKIVNRKGLAFEASFLLGFLAVFMALNITEDYMLNRSGLYWPLFVYVTLQLSFLNKTKIDQ